MNKIAMAIAAHPDDIEFMMAGTLVLLKNAGYEIHYMNLSSGNCGSTETDAVTTARIRLLEAQNSASILGAVFHPPICDDFEIFYEAGALRKSKAKYYPYAFSSGLYGRSYECLPFGSNSSICKRGSQF